LFKGLIVCSWTSVTRYFLAFSSPVVWYCLPFHGFVCFHFLCAGFFEESFVVVAWWSRIVLVSAYHGRQVVGSSQAGLRGESVMGPQPGRLGSGSLVGHGQQAVAAWEWQPICSFSVLWHGEVSTG
jgi:hypothetical protein